MSIPNEPDLPMFLARHVRTDLQDFHGPALVAIALLRSDCMSFFSCASACILISTAPAKDWFAVPGSLDDSPTPLDLLGKLLTDRRILGCID